MLHRISKFCQVESTWRLMMTMTVCETVATVVVQWLMTNASAVNDVEHAVLSTTACTRQHQDCNQGLKCAGTRRYCVLAFLRKAWDSNGTSGKLILRKGIKIAATRCHILQLKCTKFDFGWVSAPDPAGGAYSTPPDTLAGFRGACL